MKISILVPIYGVEKYIERCAISLFEQTYNNIEYIFVNDCTKDKSIEILKTVINRYPERKHQVKIINHDHNLGLGGSRLTALQKATGDYVWQVDSDDWVERDAIEKCLFQMEQGKDVVIFDYDEVDHCGNIMRIVRHKNVTVKNMLTNFYFGPSVWKHFIKRSLILDHQIWPKKEVSMAEDYMMMARVYLVAKDIAVVNKCLYHYVLLAPGSYSANMNVARTVEMCKATLAVFSFYKNYNALSKFRWQLIYSLLKRLTSILTVDRNNGVVEPIMKSLEELSPIFTKLLISPCLGFPSVICFQKKVVGHIAK